MTSTAPHDDTIWTVDEHDDGFRGYISPGQHGLAIGDPWNDAGVAVIGTLRQLHAFTGRLTVRLTEADPQHTITEHHLLVPMTAAHYDALHDHLSLTRRQLGKWRGQPGETRTISITDEPSSPLDAAAIAQTRDWLHEHGLRFTETRTTTIEHPPATDAKSS